MNRTERNVGQHYAARIASARTPYLRALVENDRVRAAIKRLAHDEQDPAWERWRQVCRQFVTELQKPRED